MLSRQRRKRKGWSCLLVSKGGGGGRGGGRGRHARCNVMEPHRVFQKDGPDLKSLLSLQPQTAHESKGGASSFKLLPLGASPSAQIAPSLSLLPDGDSATQSILCSAVQQD